MKTEIKMSDAIGKTIKDFAFSGSYNGQAVIVFDDDTFAALGIQFGYESMDADIVERGLNITEFGDSEIERVGIATEHELIDIRNHQDELWRENQKLADLEQLERLKKRLGV